MESTEIHRCPDCQALVVDRRSSSCTTCHAPLPAEWIMSPEQVAQVSEIDQGARQEHAALMEAMDPSNDPDSSAIVTDLHTNALE